MLIFYQLIILVMVYMNYHVLRIPYENDIQVAPHDQKYNYWNPFSFLDPLDNLVLKYQKAY